MTGFAELARAASAARTARPGVPLALATLVAVDGSSYRQPGARLLVDAEGRVLAGAISGGCLEGDVAARAAAVCASGEAVRLHYDLRTDLETIWGFGAACDGVAHLLLEPLTDWRWIAQADAIRGRRRGGAVITLLDARTGATCALLDGPVSDGRWHRAAPDTWPVDVRELDAIAQTVQRTAQPLLQPLAGGERLAFVEPLSPPVALHLVGAGRGAEAFAAIALTLGWSVTVLDHRPVLLEALQVPATVRIQPVRGVDGIAATVGHLSQDSRTAVALLTHIFDVDAAWLRALLPLPIGYVGVLGSRSRGAQLLSSVTQALQTEGVTITPRLTHKLHVPIGLDLGGEDPAAIALAAIAEIEAVMHGRPGGFLRERQSPIHTRSATPSLLDRTPLTPPSLPSCDLPPTD